jgi:hypothetical protein
MDEFLTRYLAHVGAHPYTLSALQKPTITIYKRCSSAMHCIKFKRKKREEKPKIPYSIDRNFSVNI